MDRKAEESFCVNAIKIQNEAQKRKRISSGDEKLPAKTVKIDNDQILDKCFSYVFKILNINVQIIKQEESFHVSNILFNRIGTGNDGNHIIPISSFTSLITHFFTVGDKTNDCISKIQRLLVFFHRIPNSTEEYNAIAAKLHEITNEDSNICCPDKLERFFCKTFVPYIIYIWDTRVSAKHFDSVDKKTVSSEGSKVKAFNQEAQNLLKQLDQINSESFYSRLDQICATLFQVIDIPIFVRENTNITKCINNPNTVNQYFKEALLFFIYRVIKIQKPDIVQKNKLINSIQHFQNKTPTINTAQISKLVRVLSKLQQEMCPEYLTIVNKLSNMKDIQDFCLNNTKSLSYLVKEYLNIILYDLRKHFQLYLSIIEQESCNYSNMYYLHTDQHKSFLKQFFDKKNFAKTFINNFRFIKNKDKLIKMFDHDNESELSFQYSDDQSLSINNESQSTSVLAEKFKKIDNIASYTPHEQKILIEDVLDLDVSSYPSIMSKLENSQNLRYVIANMLKTLITQQCFIVKHFIISLNSWALYQT